MNSILKMLVAASMLLSVPSFSAQAVSENDSPIYHQHCPMYKNGKCADWLSKGGAIKNLYYGSNMRSSAKTIETIN